VVIVQGEPGGAVTIVPTRWVVWRARHTVSVQRCCRPQHSLTPAPDTHIILHATHPPTHRPQAAAPAQAPEDAIDAQQRGPYCIPRTAAGLAVLAAGDSITQGSGETLAGRRLRGLGPPGPAIPIYAVTPVAHNTLLRPLPLPRPAQSRART
jgi:hypothetical protein